MTGIWCFTVYKPVTLTWLLSLPDVIEQDMIIVINRHIWFSLHKYSLIAHSTLICSIENLAIHVLYYCVLSLRRPFHFQKLHRALHAMRGQLLNWIFPLCLFRDNLHLHTLLWRVSKIDWLPFPQTFSGSNNGRNQQEAEERNKGQDVFPLVPSLLSHSWLWCLSIKNL